VAALGDLEIQNGRSATHPEVDEDSGRDVDRAPRPPWFSSQFLRHLDVVVSEPSGPSPCPQIRNGAEKQRSDSSAWSPPFLSQGEPR